jgi:hypothetical protein
MKNELKLFQESNIRSLWDDNAEKWYFAIVDIVAALTDSADPANYWRVLKSRLKAEGNETITNCNGLKMRAPDGKMRMTDSADTAQILRIIQSIPSPKAEPFKLWLAQGAANGWANPGSLAEFVDINKVSCVYDHHFGYENFWGKRGQIEHVGAAATQIFELFGNIHNRFARNRKYSFRKFVYTL